MAARRLPLCLVRDRDCVAVQYFAMGQSRFRHLVQQRRTRLKPVCEDCAVRHNKRARIAARDSETAVDSFFGLPAPQPWLADENSPVANSESLGRYWTQRVLSKDE
jgi:hypothetical protein